MDKLINAFAAALESLVENKVTGLPVLDSENRVVRLDRLVLYCFYLVVWFGAMSKSINSGPLCHIGRLE